MKKKLFLELLLIVTVIIGGWFLLNQFHLKPDVDFNFIDAKIEGLGKQILENLEEKYPIVKNKQVNKVIDVIKKRLLDPLERESYEYEIVVLKSNKIVNAFALPGNIIIVFSQLMKQADSPEECAAVIAHEIGHVENKHINKQIIKYIGLELLVLLLSGGDPSLLQEISKILATSAFSRQHEKEADQFALDLLFKADINPRSMADFFRKIEKRKNQDLEAFEIMSSHPNTIHRIQQSLKYKIPKDKKFRKLPIYWPSVKKFL